MLLKVDPHTKGELLSPEEALIKSFENTDKMLQQYRLDDHEELKNAEQRMGQRMEHNELVRRVCKANPYVFAEDSNADPEHVMGFYFTNRKGEKEFVCAFDKGYLPEFSIIFVDAADLPVKEKRGWRTVLLRLLAKDCLTWEQVMEIFGDAHGINSRRWRFYTRRYRNKG
jgi:hypothetical protein